MLKNILICASIIAAIFASIGGGWAAWSMKADVVTVEELTIVVEQVAMRIDKKIINDQIFALEQRIFDIQMLYKKQGLPLPPEEEKRIMEIRFNIDLLKTKLKGV
jgi:hypothetical protein